MPFIDWNNNGEIDNDDIAVGIAMLDEEDYEDEKVHKKSNPGCGCLTTTIVGLLCVSVAIAALIFM